MISCFKKWGLCILALLYTLTYGSRSLTRNREVIHVWMKAKAPVNFPVEASERKRVFWILIKANVELVLIGIYQIWTGEGRRNSPEKYSSLLKAHLFFCQKNIFWICSSMLPYFTTWKYLGVKLLKLRWCFCLHAEVWLLSFQYLMLFNIILELSVK